MSKKIDLSRKDSLFFSLSSNLFDLSRIAISFTFLPLMVSFFQRNVLIFALVFASVSFSRVLASYVAQFIKRRAVTKNSFLLFLLTTTLSLYWLSFADKFANLFSLFVSICLFTFSSSIIVKIKTIFLSSFFKLKVRYFTYYRFWRWKWFISPLSLLFLFLISSRFSPEQKYNAILLTFSVIVTFSFLLFLFIDFYKLENPELNSKEYYKTVHYPRERSKTNTFPRLIIGMLYSFAYGTFSPLIIYYFKLFLLFSDIHLILLLAIGMFLSRYCNEKSYNLLETVKKPMLIVVIVSLLLISVSTSFVLFSNALLVSIMYLLWRVFHSIFITIIPNIILSLPINDNLKKFSLNPYTRWISIATGIVTSGIFFSIYSSLAFILTSIIYMFITFLTLIGLFFSPLINSSVKIEEERITGEW